MTWKCRLGGNCYHGIDLYLTDMGTDIDVWFCECFIPPHTKCLPLPSLQIEALVPEDGFAVVRTETGELVVTRPPFTERRPVTPGFIYTAILLMGYDAVKLPRARSWQEVVDQIEQMMIQSSGPIDDDDLRRRVRVMQRSLSDRRDDNTD